MSHLRRAGVLTTCLIGVVTWAAAPAGAASPVVPLPVRGTTAPVVGSVQHLPGLDSTSVYSAGSGPAKAITGYHDSGAYAADQAAVTKAAVTWMNSWVRRGCGAGCKPAAVFDLDDTTWSWYPTYAANGFAPTGQVTGPVGTGCQTPLIDPVIRMIRRAQALNVTVFFITGRSPSDRDFTLACLAGFGLPTDHLITKAADQGTLTSVQFKGAARAEVERQGWTIGPSIGDQLSDVTGAHFLAGFVLPNPMYYIP
jgi:hypothetical protein